MPKDKTLDELVIGIIGVGGATSLGFYFLNKLLEKYHLIGKGGISRILINDANEKRAKSLIDDHISTHIPVESAKLKTIADEADVYFFTYATPFGAQKKYHGIDRELRKKLFNANIDALYAKDMIDAFGGSKGLGIFCTNPPDYLAYFAPDIFGWERNQSIGFNHADTYRLWNLKSVALNLINSWMIGDHSPNSFAHFSPDVYLMLNAACKGDIRAAERRIKEIIKEVHKKGFQIFEVMGHSNANCATPLADVAEGIVTRTGEFQMSYYIELPKDLPSGLLAELTDLQNSTGIALDGICTGVPLVFRKIDGVVRADIAPRFGSGHVFNTSILEDAEDGRYSEKRNFASVIENNAKEILTAKQYGKKHGGKPLLPTENTLLILRNVLTNELLLYETKKDIYASDPSILFKERKSSHVCAGLDISAMDTYKNKLATVSGGKATLWKFPYKDITDIVSGKKDCIEQEEDLGPVDSSVCEIALLENEVYLADPRNIEKRDLKGKVIAKTKKSLDSDIWSILANDSGLFCCCSEGKIIEFDSDLNQKTTYSTKVSTENMHKAKLIDYEGKKYLFGINDSGEIYMWKPGELNTEKRWQSQNQCFDVQLEPYDEGMIICIYRINEDNCLEVERILPATASRLDTIKTDISCSTDIKDIRAEGNDVYLITNKRIRSFLNKETRNLDISLPDKYVKQIRFTKYKK